MAAYTSSQTGNWDLASTWGNQGIPGNGDTWTISANHVVTYSNTTFQTSGVDNGTIINTGRIIFESNSRFKLNGLIECYGDWTMNANTTINIVGGNTASHGIYIRQPTSGITQTVRMTGSTGMPETSLTANITEKQGYLAVTDASSFGVNEWISAFKRGISNITQRTDEGFLVHDIDGNNIYVREFVGPSSNITDVNGSVITVENSKLYREWQTIIFGSGANRNVSNVVSIDNVSNTITLESTPSGNVIGSTVYTTGPIRQKNSGDIVRKVAFYVNADAASDATSFTVTNSTGLNVGDEIVVDSLLENNNYTDERPERRTITAINGNTITVNSAFGYPIYVSAWCVRLTRDCKIQTDDSGTQYGFFRMVDNGSSAFNSNNRLEFRDVEFRNLGTSIDDFRSRSGPMFNGRYNNDLGYDGIEIEGVTSHRDAARNLSNAGMYFYRWCYRWTVRNCVSFESVRGIWFERGYDMNDIAFYNNYSARSEDTLFRWQDARYELGEFAYNYGHRADDQALLITSNRVTGIGIHHNWFRVGQNRGINTNINYGSFALFQNRVEDMFGSAVFGFNNGMGNFIYNYFEATRTLDFTLDTDIQLSRRGLDPNHSVISLEHNFEREAVVELFPGGKRSWDEEEQAWFVQHDDDVFSADNGAGHCEIIYIPPDTSFKVRVTIKFTDGWSGTAPKLEVREITNRGGTTHNFIAGHNGNPLIPYVTSTSANGTLTGWQNVDVSVPATKYGTRYIIAFIPVSGNSSSTETEGWYEKPFKIYLNKPLPTQEFAGINRYSASEIGTRTSFDTKIIRLGGRFK